MRMKTHRYAVVLLVTGLIAGLMVPAQSAAQDGLLVPDESAIVFLSGTSDQPALSLIATSGAPQPLYDTLPVVPGSVAWSPDGTRIVFAVEASADETTLLVWDASTGSTAPILDFAGRIETVVWSPGGSQLAFAGSEAAHFDIYTVNAAGSGLLNLTNDPAEDRTPTWAPDGTRLAFSSDRNSTPSIFTMTASGADVTRLTMDEGADYSPRWSPDGMRIAFLSNRDGNDNVFTIDFNGTNLVRLSQTAFDDQDITWSPDGVRVAFAGRTEPMIAELFSINADGFDLQQHTADEAQLAGITWSPDGQWLAYSSDRTGTFAIYATEWSGTGWTTLASDATTDQTNPLWSAARIQSTQAPTATPAESPDEPVDASPTLLPLPTATQPPTSTPLPSPPPTLTPPPAATTPQADLLLIYDPAAPTFELINVAGRSLDLSGLRFEGNGTAVDATLWNQATLSSSLFNFEANGCLGLWGFDIVAQPELPPECRHRHGWWQSNNIIFWAGQSFDVFNNGVALATCGTGAGRCEVRLNGTDSTDSSANSPTLPAPSTTPAPSAGTGDLLLVYDTALPSFYLVNISGERLDISTLVFEGNGVTADSSIWLPVMTSSLFNFAVEGCLGLWSFGIAPQPPPAECRTRQGWLESDRWLFWTAGSFTVRSNAMVLGTCETAAGRCVFSLPQ